MRDLSEQELDQLGMLLAKASGVEPEEPPTNPFAYSSNPDDPRNYSTELTVDGLLYERCSIPGQGDRLTGIRNRAYCSAALPRKPGCDRRRL